MGLYGKSRSPGYRPGDHWITCQRCGFTLYSSRGEMEWTNLIVCPKCLDPRHPQDFVRGVKEDIAAKGLVTGQGSDTDVSPDDLDDSAGDHDDIPTETITNSL